MKYTDLKPGTVFVKDGAPWLVLSSAFTKKHRQAGTVRLRTRNLISGKILEMSAQASDEFKEANVEKTPAVFIYERKGEYWFHEAGNKQTRFLLTEEALGTQTEFLKPNTEITALKFNEKIFGIELPIKIDLKVTEAPPSIKGNTSQGGTKSVIVETGAKINTPLFIEEGDVIRVNTETGEYVERA
jgi:elongation factor P